MIRKIINQKLFCFNLEQNKIEVSKLPIKIPRDGMSAKKFKVVTIIDTALLIPPIAGIPYRLYYLSDTLAKMGHPQTWIVGNRKFRKIQELEELKQVNVKIYLLPPAQFYKINCLLTLIEKEKPDIIQFEETPTFLKLGLFLKRSTGLPIILEIHDIEALLRKSLGRKEQEVDLAHFLQYFAGQCADALITTTMEDYRVLINQIGIPKEKLFFAPNGVRTNIPNRKINVKENILVYLGNMFYWPNQQGLIFLIEKVLPLVQKTFPDVKLKIIGGAPETLKSKYQSKSGVMFIGQIKNRNILNRELSNSTIGLCTVFAGSGMKVKILDYAINGLPVIVTPLGMSGYSDVKSLIHAKPSKENVSQKIIELLKDKDRAANIGKKTRKIILQKFAWRKIAKTMINTYEFAYRLNKSTKGIFNIPFPLWLEEKRYNTGVSKQIFLINKGKIKLYENPK